VTECRNFEKFGMLVVVYKDTTSHIH